MCRSLEQDDVSTMLWNQYAYNHSNYTKNGKNKVTYFWLKPLES